MAPVVNDDASDSRKQTVSAISSAVPTRPIGWSWNACATKSGYLALTDAVSGVPTNDGHTALTRMFFLTYSIAAFFVRPATPCLATTYAAAPGSATRPAADAVLTIDPPPSASMILISCAMHLHTDLRLMFMAMSQSSSFMSATADSSPAMPALLNAQSRRANGPPTCL